MPGTDTCLKVGGFVRAETIVNGGASFSQFVNENFDSRALDHYRWRARAAVTLDARSQTEYGTLRAYIQHGWNVDQDNTGSIYTNRAFIQFAGFTAGLANSFFNAFGFSSYSNQTNVLTSDTGGGGHLVWAYTAQFGNGLSASVSIEDGELRRSRGTIGSLAVGSAGTVSAAGVATAATATDLYGGTNLPDFVANLRVDQSWGYAQIMGALHEVVPAASGYSNKMGYAVGAAFQLNLPMLGVGDNIGMQVAYAKGASGYNFRAATFGARHNGVIAAGSVTDAVLGPAGAVELTESWSIGAGYNHGWNRQWKTSIYGGYGEVDYSATAEGFMGTAAGLSNDFAFWQIGTRTVWTPVANLDLSIDVIYNNIDSATAPATAVGAIPARGDVDWFAGIFRAQRNFYP